MKGFELADVVASGPFGAEAVVVEVGPRSWKREAGVGIQASPRHVFDVADLHKLPGRSNRCLIHRGVLPGDRCCRFNPA